MDTARLRNVDGKECVCGVVWCEKGKGRNIDIRINYFSYITCMFLTVVIH